MNSDSAWLCETCGTQLTPSKAPPPRCRICEPWGDGQLLWECLSPVSGAALEAIAGGVPVYLFDRHLQAIEGARS